MIPPLAYKITPMVIIIILCSLELHLVYIQGQRDVSPSRANLQKQPTSSQFNITCGTTDELASRVEVCAAPLMNIIQGTTEKWPKTENDIADLCQDIHGCEHCIRENSRKCAKGLHKTIISTVANSIQKVRRRECTPGQYQKLLRATQCIEDNQVAIRNLMSNATSYLRVVELDMRDQDRKMNAFCCMVHEIEDNIKHVLSPVCRDDAKLVVRIYRATLEDVMDLICRNPKCNDTFKGFKVKRTNNFEGLVSIMLRVVFSVS